MRNAIINLFACCCIQRAVDECAPNEVEQEKSTTAQNRKCPLMILVPQNAEVETALKSSNVNQPLSTSKVLYCVIESSRGRNSLLG